MFLRTLFYSLPTRFTDYEADALTIRKRVGNEIAGYWFLLPLSVEQIMAGLEAVNRQREADHTT